MKTIVTLCVALICTLSVNGFVTNGQSGSKLTAEFDKLVSSEVKGQEPGGVVLFGWRRRAKRFRPTIRRKINPKPRIGAGTAAHQPRYAKRNLPITIVSTTPSTKQSSSIKFISVTPFGRLMSTLSIYSARRRSEVAAFASLRPVRNAW